MRCRTRRQKLPPPTSLINHRSVFFSRFSGFAMAEGHEKVEEPAQQSRGLLEELGLEGSASEEEGEQDQGNLQGGREEGEEEAEKPREWDADTRPNESWTTGGSGLELRLRVPDLGAVGEGATAKLMRTSNVLGIQPRKYDGVLPEDEEGSSVTAVARWRENPETGKLESNARLVRWEDGSCHLFVGKEALEVSERDAMNDCVHLALKRPPAPGERTSLLQGQGRVASRVGFAPATLESALHKRLTSAVGRKSVRKGHVQQTAVTVDPEMDANRRAQEEEGASKRERERKRKQEEKRKQFSLDGKEHSFSLAPEDLEVGAEEEEEEDYDDDDEGRGQPPLKRRVLEESKSDDEGDGE